MGRARESDRGLEPKELPMLMSKSASSDDDGLYLNLMKSGHNLKPCPFCGGAVVLNNRNRRPEEGYPDEYGVECDNCRINMYNNASSKEQATQAWNTRVSEVSGAN